MKAASTRDPIAAGMRGTGSSPGFAFPFPRRMDGNPAMNLTPAVRSRSPRQGNPGRVQPCSRLGSRIFCALGFTPHSPWSVAIRHGLTLIADPASCRSAAVLMRAMNPAPLRALDGPLTSSSAEPVDVPRIRHRQYASRPKCRPQRLRGLRPETKGPAVR